MQQIKLTQFSHGGGCGCKISPAILAELLAHTPVPVIPPELLVGTDTSDDAAVYQLNAQQAVIATTDFFTPIVDDPKDFGCIAAANALSDVYAMGGTAIMALAIVGMPLDKLPREAIAQILEGGASICQKAGIPVAGGHSIDVLEPIYGLVAIGVVNPAHLMTNANAQAGDVLVLTKPLGIGILSAALKKGALSQEGYQEIVRWTTLLNRVGADLAVIDGVHALTDVTGFGLCGHLLEMCKGAKLHADIDFNQLPFIPAALQLVKEGYATGASNRNWLSYGESVMLPANVQEWQQKLLTDPQTSGGLLIACRPSALEQVQAALQAVQGNEGTVIGQMTTARPGITVKLSV